MSTAPRWQARSRATSSVSAVSRDDYSPPPSRSASTLNAEDASSRLRALSAADLARRDSDALSIRSRSSSFVGLSTAAASPAPSRVGSPSKRQKLEDVRPPGSSRRVRQASQPAPAIPEDPSASLLLANGDAPFEAAPPVPPLPAQFDAPRLKKQRSWADMYRQVALGEPPAPGEQETLPVGAAAGPSKVEMGTQTGEEPILSISQPEGWSWFSWSRSNSTKEGLADLAKPATATTAASQSTIPASVMLSPQLLPVRPGQTAAMPMPRSVSQPVSRRGSVDQPPIISPGSSSLRTLIAGRGRRGNSQTRSPRLLPTRKEEGVQTESPERSSLDSLPALGPPVTVAAPPLAVTTSRSSWWSRGPAAAPEPTSQPPASTTSPVISDSAAMAASSSTASTSSASEVKAIAVSEAAPGGGWLGWWSSKPAEEPATIEAVISSAPVEVAMAAVSPPPPVNPIIDTLPESRSAWSRYFGGKNVARQAIKDEMEVMTVDFPAPSAGSATPPISPQLQAIDRGSKPSSVRSLPVGVAEPVKDKPAAKPLTASKKASKAAMKPNAPNLVLPTFRDSFERPPRSLPPRQGAIAKALSVVNAYLGSQPNPRPSQGPPDFSERLPKTFEVMGRNAHLERVRRIVVIGVHGWFPAAIVQPLLGRPTGTSIKFASMMSTSVHDYLASQGHELEEGGLTSIVLEGEGKISDRVDRLYGNLAARLEWVDALRAADMVFVATHSQGSIVSTQLIGRLLAEGHTKGSKVHMLAMASVSHGPFPYLAQSWSLTPYFQYVEGEAARELFVLQDADSPPSQHYRDSVQAVLSAGVKITLVASCDDQVVPLSSGLFHSLSHPGILRAVFVDSQAFASADFIVNLVVFAVRLRNAGLSDHDLLPQLSEALAGSLTGVGHSRIYEDRQVYDLAVRYAFETTSTMSLPTTSTSLAPIAATHAAFDPRVRKTNPHYLPWILRGVIEDPKIRSLFGEELSELRDAFDDWHPQSKALRDVKYQLEPLRTISRRVPLPETTEKVPNKTAKL